MQLINTSRLYILATILVFSVAMSACYPSPGSLTATDLDVVVTVYDKNVDFSANRTFAMQDSVIHLKPDNISDNISRQHDDLILAEVAKGLTDMGYQRITVIDPDNPPDVVVYVGVTTTEWRGYVYTPAWPWYPWYPGYPWYPVGGVAYSYETGTLLVEMIDPTVATPSKPEGGSVWLAALNGLLTTSNSGSVTRLTTGIRQMYSQSPYLKPGS